MYDFPKFYIQLRPVDNILLSHPKPTCSCQGNPTFPGTLELSGAVDGWSEAPDVVPVDAERREDIRFVEEIHQHSRRPQEILNSHDLVQRSLH